MDNPGQFLIHITNRGDKVFSRQLGDVEQFTVNTRQPIKDINKFGLLHYSIPKQIDMLNETNNRFTIILGFGDGTTVEVPVTLPILDYYSLSTTFNTVNGDTQQQTQLALDELLQSTINWAIQIQYAQYPAGNPYNANDPRNWGEALLGRISCLVRREDNGLLSFTFGYRGHQNVANPNDMHNRGYAPGVLPNTGNPDQQYNQYKANGVATQAQLIPIIGNVLAPENNPLVAWQVGGANYGNNFPAGMNLTSVTFADLSPRVTMLLGMRSGLTSNDIINLAANNDEYTRGRIRLKCYPVGNFRTNLVKLTAEVPPNLDPPSFLYLQMTVSGTRSKILGQQDERGGWAVPTPQSGFQSLYMNIGTSLPIPPVGPVVVNQLTGSYNARNVRFMPCVGNQTDYANLFLNNAGHLALGFMYDPIPHQSAQQDGNNIYQADNYSLWFGNVNTRSRIIKFGQFQELTYNPILPKHKFVKSSDCFGTGPYKQSSVFTVSLVEPNFIFTQVENITLQTFDVRLLWGDTQEPVVAQAPNPVQFSIIASP